MFVVRDDVLFVDVGTICLSESKTRLLYVVFRYARQLPHLLFLTAAAK